MQKWSIRLQLIVDDPDAGLDNHPVQSATVDIPPVPEYNYPEMFRIMITLAKLIPLPSRGVPFEPIEVGDPAKVARSQFAAGMLESLRQFKEYGLRYNDATVGREVAELVDQKNNLINLPKKY